MSSGISQLSLRDPAGVLYDMGGRLLRVVRPEFVPQCEFSLTRRSIGAFLSNGTIVPTRRLSHDEVNSVPLPHWGTVLEHEKVPFISYPHEWSPGMLAAAGHLTLDIAEKILDDGLGLKDASCYNVIFRNGSPTFVDFLSFEKRDELDSLWCPFGQFVRHFINPLIAAKFRNLPLQWTFCSNGDGLPSELLYELLSVPQRFHPSLFPAVTFPVLLGKLNVDKRSIARKASSQREAAFVLKLLFRNLRRVLEKVTPERRRSRWTDYDSSDRTYSSEEKNRKLSVVSSLIERAEAKSVLDIGCNSGTYSQMASRAGAEVVAIDSDVACIDELWGKKLSRVLPMVMDLANPSPSLGWINREHSSFLERAHGKFDLVLALAVLHHLQSKGIPTEKILSFFSRLTNRRLILEFVAPEDEIWSALGGNQNFPIPNQANFESLLFSYFEIESITEVKSSRRWLYCLTKRQVGSRA